ncbi:MAG: hypothetical protein LC126_07875 [Bryobacterales bacterium]|nr:hypothetical protein [Bryobacterales bacterium]
MESKPRTAPESLLDHISRLDRAVDAPLERGAFQKPAEAPPPAGGRA